MKLLHGQLPKLSRLLALELDFKKGADHEEHYKEMT